FSQSDLEYMPREGDFTFLWWANGPQQFLGMKGPPPEPILCMQSGLIGLAIDTKNLRILHAGRFRKPLNRQTALKDANDAVFALPPVPLELSVYQGDRKFTCVGRGQMPKDQFFFPVRFVESGRFFQRVAIEDIEFADANGEKLSVNGQLEVAFWPD